ncbi:ADP-glucose pyrophosphorylase [Mesobaculum littorinae]|uniref:ADP-glucose pyrophosphorylase n=1 Tax=Mesobaculum littorinae TaxID=2486419 RepID=A0A438AID4_9RHOB|nr:sugar phosphate nucleotidyltransferase [Mesobaculum littorinae]RVV98460.1 ADP-glucose pyrophosphorylase [Mesobaculum littorinae]
MAQSFDDRDHHAGAPLRGVATILLAGGQGSRLHELTEAECKPAIPFATRERIVDFTLANAVRSGLTLVIVATQYRPATLTRHLFTSWRRHFPGGLVIRDGATVTGRAGGYAGTADAVRANLDTIEAEAPTEVVVLAGDHVYQMDYAAMIAAHRASGAKATVAVDVVAVGAARGFGVLDADLEGRIHAFQEKPVHPAAIPGDPAHALASMGIYVFDWPWLRSRLNETDAAGQGMLDFGGDVVPRAVADGAALAFRLPPHAGPQGARARGYWRDVGTLDSYRRTALEFLGNRPPCDLPSALRDRAQAPDETGAPVVHKIIDRGLFRRLAGTVVMPGAFLSAGIRLSDAIVAPGTVIPFGLVVGEDEDEDATWFRRTSGGTTLITARMLARRAAERTRTYAIPGIGAVRPAPSEENGFDVGRL